MCFIVRYSLHIYIVVVGLVAFSGIVDRYVDRHLAAHRTLARLPAVVENGFRHYQVTHQNNMIVCLHDIPIRHVLFDARYAVYRQEVEELLKERVSVDLTINHANACLFSHLYNVACI